jgi:hypothetical protein
MALGVMLTTHHFLCSLQMGPPSQSVTLQRLVRLDSDSHSSLFGPFISYKENEVL